MSGLQYSLQYITYSRLNWLFYLCILFQTNVCSWLSVVYSLYNFLLHIRFPPPYAIVWNDWSKTFIITTAFYHRVICFPTDSLISAYFSTITRCWYPQLTIRRSFMKYCYTYIIYVRKLYDCVKATNRLVTIVLDLFCYWSMTDCHNFHAPLTRLWVYLHYEGLFK